MSPGGRDTIYALSSGNPPAAIAIVRISGAQADAALQQLVGRLPEARFASFVKVRDPASGEELDRGLALRFPGPGSATGEDLAELHLHGGRSVVAAVLGALAGIDGLRPAEAGEFTRRAFENGRIDLAEAEGLADLLAAETEAQRRAALALAGGSVSRMIAEWQQRLLGLAARLEAALDFSDEGEVGEEPPGLAEDLVQLIADMDTALARPSLDRLRDGVRVVIAGPPNAGKSSLFNALVGREAAITSPTAGTTRDLVEAPTAISGSPYLLVDTAGLRASEDEIETIGVAKALDSVEAADLILWLGGPGDCPREDVAIKVRAKCDLNSAADPLADIAVSALTGQGIGELIGLIEERARALLPREGETALNARHRAVVEEALSSLRDARGERDLLLMSEGLRQARLALDRFTGRAGVEEMLDSLFGRFCIGK